jgi:hypothetical protein
MTMHRLFPRTLSLEFLAKRGIAVFSQPFYSHDLAPDDFFICQIKHWDERDEIRGRFIDPAHSDDRTESDTGQALSPERCKSYPETGRDYIE